MQTTNIVRNVLATVSVVLVAGALIGSTQWKSTGQVPAASASVPTPMIAIATGELDRGAPVYRLPPVTVTVSRSAALAAMAQEEMLAAK